MQSLRRYDIIFFLKMGFILHEKYFVNQHQGKVPPKPTRGKKIKGSTESLNGVSDDEKPTHEINIRDIVPRVDITPQITDALISEFSDKDWKVNSKRLIYIKTFFKLIYIFQVRSDALTKLQNIVNEAKFITSELGECRKALQDRYKKSIIQFILWSDITHFVDMGY